MDSVFTVTEVVRLMNGLDGHDAITARAVRYYARTKMVEPSKGSIDGDRGARLYTLTDVAVLRLIRELRRRGVHERAVWGVLVYRSAEVRDRLASRTGAIEIDDPARLIVAHEGTSPFTRIRIPVALVTGGLRVAAARLRRHRPRLWTGAKWIPATATPAADQA